MGGGAPEEGARGRAGTWLDELCGGGGGITNPGLLYEVKVEG